MGIWNEWKISQLRKKIVRLEVKRSTLLGSVEMLEKDSLRSIWYYDAKGDIKGLDKHLERCNKELAWREGSVAQNYVIRKEVADFAKLMEEALRANEHKGGWRDSTFKYLLDKLAEETNELRIACVSASSDHTGYLDAVQKEAADVANFAMMIADNAAHRKEQRDA